MMLLQNDMLGGTLERLQQKAYLDFLTLSVFARVVTKT